MTHAFKKNLYLSLGLHFGLVLVVFIGSFWQNTPPKTYKVTWITPSLGDGGMNTKANFKNSKTLPQSTLREQKQVLKDRAKSKSGSDLKTKSGNVKKSNEAVTQKRTSETAGVNLNAKTNPKDDLKISDALARIDKQLQQREVDFSTAQAKAEDAGMSQYGSESGSATDPEALLYYETLKRKIMKEWILGDTSFASGLSVEIVVLIDSQGELKSSSYQKTSGNTTFDESALRAIRRAVPFPPPPESVKREALAEGFEFAFDPSGVTGTL